MIGVYLGLSFFLGWLSCLWVHEVLIPWQKDFEEFRRHRADQRREEEKKKIESTKILNNRGNDEI